MQRIVIVGIKQYQLITWYARFRKYLLLGYSIM